MKKQFLLITITFSLLMAGCHKESTLAVKELDPEKDAKLAAGILQSHEDGIPFPDGTKVLLLESGDTRLVLPEGYHFIMTDLVTGEIVDPGDDEEAGVTCTCTKGSGCTPVKFRKKYYCVMDDGCSSCDKSTTSATGAKVKISGIYNEDEGISILVKNTAAGLKKELTSTIDQTLGNAGSALFKTPGIKEELIQLYHFIYDNHIPAFITANEKTIPNGYGYIAVSIHGNIAAIPVPENMITSSYYRVDDEGKASCKCNDATPVGCEKDSYFGAVFCEAKGCKSCSLLD
jgi:hypothetical protein